MDRKTLNQYVALLKEQESNDKAIDKLYARAEEIPVVAGKVVGSSHDFPYTEVRTTVLMDEPVEAEEINKRLRIKKDRQERIMDTVLEIEEYIAAIPDSVDRQIFELCFLEGMTQQKAGEIVGFSKGRISQKISAILKD